MNKMILGSLAALFLSLSASAQNIKPTISLPLYPEGQDVDKGIVEDGKAITLGPLESNEVKGDVIIKGNGYVYNIGDGARIDIYLPEKCNGKMIVNTPGGAYAFVAMQNEGSFAAEWFVQRGFAVCVVQYRIPNHHNLVPVHDVQNAFRYCRAHAEEWGVKQIGVMGYSAGGHLAASASNLFVDDITRPDFAILVYPVITMDEFITHGGTRYNLLPKKVTKELVDQYSMDKRVSPKTPPTLLLLCADDTAVVPENSIRYYRAMLENKVPGELHILGKGGHGWGFSTIEHGRKDQLSSGQRTDFFNIIERWLSELK